MYSVDSNAKVNSKQLRTPSSDETVWSCIQDVLRDRAQSVPTKYLFFYPLGSTASSTPRQVSYSTLYTQAECTSKKLASLTGFGRGRPVLLHLDDHWDAIVWFWAVVLAHGVPVMSPPLSNIEENRKKHLQGLSQLLESPICITRAYHVPLFENDKHTLQLYSIETLEAEVKLKKAHDSHHTSANVTVAYTPDSGSLAALMLTSGSTGNAKAVPLRHTQMLAAVAGKMSMRSLPADGAFLNWIGMDHVAALLETHLPALWLGLDQIHVHATDIIAYPSLFMELLSRHHVSRTFAPNFFLAQLVASNSFPPPVPRAWDLSTLTALISGGEANDMETVTAAAALLSFHGAPSNVIQPGFGMTETCAGAIYNIECPAYDIRLGRSVASLGRCIPGMEMRVVDDTGKCRAPGKPGYLEVRGAVVFDGYYRNPAATTEAFASGNGWFRTGDRAIIDVDGNMGMIGRAKEVININGVKVVTAEVQAALETALRGTGVKRIVCFPSRAPGAVTEQITVAYVSREEPLLPEDMADIDSRVVQACMMVTTAGKPCVFMVRESSLHLLPTSTLGKISGAKMRALFEGGAFDKDAVYHRQNVEAFRRQKQQMTAHITVAPTEQEELLQADFAETKGFDMRSIGIDTPIFELGFTSLDLIRLKHRISNRLRITIATIMLMRNPTVRTLAIALNEVKLNTITLSPAVDAGLTADSEYDPVVVLWSGGSKTPLWLVHPGVGEVLVFVGLAQHMKEDNRSIYALRARGFEPGQHNFTCIAEAVDTYTEAIRRKQPQGPYAIAGYSYGAMLAFETAKKLEGAGEAVSFLASFNLPPHIKHRMRQLTWKMCLLHLGQFLGLIDELTVDKTAEDNTTYRDAPRAVALRYMLTLADVERLHELGLDEAALSRWTDVAYGLQSMAIDYEPTGSVATLDVFHAEPLRVAASSRDEWVGQHLSRWHDFCRTRPRLHEVEGGHYTMIGPDHVVLFTRTLRAALEARGV
ncbi:acetyl-CoA synthetase-like protein [Annulohypoxylon bovei var. microspora]|nr:acetyl-CoA synthetase-like protein [Annulohypoxylon bovei var. microspora]